MSAPTVHLAGESRSTGHGYRRHRHTRYRTESGVEIVVTRYVGGSARVVVFHEDHPGSRREYREGRAGTDAWLISAVGYRLGGA